MEFHRLFPHLSSERQWEQRNEMPVAFSFPRNLSINFYYDALLNEFFTFFSIINSIIRFLKCDGALFYHRSK